MKTKLIEVLEEYSNKEGSYELKELKNKKLGDFIISTEKVHGGCEGAGEEHWVVLKVEHEGKTSFWEIPGWYQSYDGSTLEVGNLFEVESKEVVITVWKEKK